MGKSTEAKELLALAEVSTKTKALHRFRLSVKCMEPEYAKLFRNLSTKEVSLYSKGACLERSEGCLIWKLRERPSLPESYNNQQTSAGLVNVYLPSGKSNRQL